ncbi:MAG TPA: hypothetical protein VNO81_12530 [Candidatus Nitrosotenuis sp.]|nr:hypothetical protein [Candidatus Nitrosotenuis sp.]
MPCYRYVQLDPAGPDRPDYDLGIEVTDPGLVGGRPNLDPQHGPGGSPARSAIEEALHLPLPGPGARLATLRPDPDSVGCMAVLECRALGLRPDPGLVRAIGRLDALGPAAWRLEEVRARERELRAARVICLGPGSLQEKVAFMGALLTGSCPPEQLEELYRKDLDELARAERELTLRWLVPEEVLMVEGDSPRAFEVGYRYAEVVVACNPTYRRPWVPGDPPHGKWTIARAHPGAALDIAGLTRDLAEAEPGWGGTANLVASPQGRTPVLPREEILALVRKHLRNGPAPRVLLVDDDPSFRSGLASRLRKLCPGLQVEEIEAAEDVACLADALLAAGSGGSAWLVLDLVLGNRSGGLEVVRAVRRHLPPEVLPILLLTGRVGSWERTAADRHGCHLLEKGEDLEETAAAVVLCLGLRPVGGQGLWSWLSDLDYVEACARAWLAPYGLERLQAWLESGRLSEPWQSRLEAIRARGGRPTEADLAALGAFDGGPEELSPHDLSNYRRGWASILQALAPSNLKRLAVPPGEPFEAAAPGAPPAGLASCAPPDETTVRRLLQALEEAGPYRLFWKERLAERRGREHPGSGIRSVLVLEDEDPIAAQIIRVVQGLPAPPEIVRVATAARARQALASQPFDAAVLDLAVPEAEGGRAEAGQGLALLEEQGPSVRWVVLTAAQDFPGVAARVLADRGVRAADFIFKDDPNWQEQLARCLSREAAEEPLEELILLEETGHLAYFNRVPVVLDRDGFHCLAALALSPGVLRQKADVLATVRDRRAEERLPGFDVARTLEDVARQAGVAFRRLGRTLAPGWFRARESVVWLSGEVRVGFELPSPRPLRVLCVEDDPAAAARVARLWGDLSREPLEVVAEDSRASEALAVPGPTLLILDLEIPRGERRDPLCGLELLARVQRPDLRTVVFTAHDLAGLRREAERLGVRGIDYVSKEASDGRLLQSLWRARRELERQVVLFSPGSTHWLMVDEEGLDYVWLDGRPVGAAPRRRHLLWTLADRGGSLDVAELSEALGLTDLEPPARNRQKWSKGIPESAIRSLVDDTRKMLRQALGEQAEETPLVGSWSHPMKGRVVEGFRLDCPFLARRGMGGRFTDFRLRAKRARSSAALRALWQECGKPLKAEIPCLTWERLEAAIGERDCPRAILALLGF